MSNAIYVNKNSFQGENIKSLRTLKSMYDNDCIEATTEKGVYRIPMGTILSMVDYFVFDRVKKTKHTYLEDPQCLYDEYGQVPTEVEKED